MSVTYMIVTEEVSREDLEFLHTGQGKPPRKKLEVGDIGVVSTTPAIKGCVNLLLLDGSPQGAAVTVRNHKLRKLSEETVGLLRSISDLALRWKTYSSPGVLSAARAIRVGSAVVYRKNKYTRSIEHLGVVVAMGRVDGREGTRYSVELLGLKSEIVDNELKRGQLQIKKPDEPVVAKLLDLSLCQELQDMVDTVMAFRATHNIHRDSRAAGVMTRHHTAVAEARAAVADDAGDSDAWPGKMAGNFPPLKERVCVVLANGTLVGGVVKWKGNLPGYPLIVGLEMEKEIRQSDVDSQLNLGKDHFQCHASRRLYCPVNSLLPYEAMFPDPAPTQEPAEPAPIGSRVGVLLRNGDVVPGTVRWKGKRENEVVVGLEMDRPVDGSEVEDPIYKGGQFKCATEKRLFRFLPYLVPYEEPAKAGSRPADRGGSNKDGVITREPVSTRPSPGNASADQDVLGMEMRGFNLSREQVMREQADALRQIQGGHGNRPENHCGDDADQHSNNDRMSEERLAKEMDVNMAEQRRLFAEATASRHPEQQAQQQRLGQYGNGQNDTPPSPTSSFEMVSVPEIGQQQQTSSPAANRPPEMSAGELEEQRRRYDDVTRKRSREEAQSGARASSCVDSGGGGGRGASGARPTLHKLANQQQSTEIDGGQQFGVLGGLPNHISDPAAERTAMPGFSTSTACSSLPRSVSGDPGMDPFEVVNRSDCPPSLGEEGASTRHSAGQTTRSRRQSATDIIPYSPGPAAPQSPHPRQGNSKTTSQPPVAAHVLNINDRVSLDVNGVLCYGNVHFVGRVPQTGDEEIAGIELDEEYKEFGRCDGKLEGLRLFTCENNRAVFVKSSTCHPAVELSAQALSGGSAKVAYNDGVSVHAKLKAKNRAGDWIPLATNLGLDVKQLLAMDTFQGLKSDSDFLLAVLFHYMSPQQGPSLEHLILAVKATGHSDIAEFLVEEGRKDGRLTSRREQQRAAEPQHGVATTQPSVPVSTISSANSVVAGPSSNTSSQSLLHTNSGAPQAGGGAVFRAFASPGSSPPVSKSSTSATSRPFTHTTASSMPSSSARQLLPKTQAPDMVAQPSTTLINATSLVPRSRVKALSERVQQSRRMRMPRSQPVSRLVPPPLSLPDEFLGWNRGIQGQHNSCYMDSSLFAMFFQSMAFDDLLHRPLPLDSTVRDRDLYEQVQLELRDSIVNPLRKTGFVSDYHVLKLRGLLKTLIQGIEHAEKDPEEYLVFLWEKVLQTKPFLTITCDGHSNTSFTYQMFVSRNQNWQVPEIQQLLEESFEESKLHLAHMPKILILQLPRHGREFKVYDQIAPTFRLNLSNVLEAGHICCAECQNSNVAWRCYDCSTARVFHYLCCYCETSIHRGRRADHRRVSVDATSRPANSLVARNLESMELFAVVCIQLSHYVTFVKCGTGESAPWCFFDSMADREEPYGGEGYNIPRIVAMDDLMTVVENAKRSTPFSMQNMSAEMKRLFNDPYICFYQCNDMLMSGIP